ncbi:MAG: DUF3221 domain-containing protein [Turicibacter sp.]
MKKWGFIGIICVFVLIGCSQFLKVETQPTVVIEGVVIKHMGENQLLISQKKGFSSKDLSLNESILLDDSSYDLITVKGDVKAFEVGMIVRASLTGEIMESYPPKANASKIEKIGVVTSSEVDKEPENNTVLKPVLPYSETLLKVFPQTINLSQRFNGYAEYGHIQTLNEVHAKGSDFELVFDGVMMDGYGDSENRNFVLTYQIDEQSVVEKIENFDPHSMLGQDNLLVSIIPNKVVLKTPLEVGNSWLETFPYAGKDYTAKTSIVRAELNDDNLMEYETLTIVEGIDDYYQNIYKEKRVFVTGSGMTSFSNLFSIDAVGVVYEEEDQSEDLYMFGFGLSVEEVIKASK